MTINKRIITIIYLSTAIGFFIPFLIRVDKDHTKEVINKAISQIQSDHYIYSLKVDDYFDWHIPKDISIKESGRSLSTIMIRRRPLSNGLIIKYRYQFQGNYQLLAFITTDSIGRVLAIWTLDKGAI